MVWLKKMAVAKPRFAKLRTIDGATGWDEEIRIIQFIIV